MFYDKFQELKRLFQLGVTQVEVLQQLIVDDHVLEYSLNVPVDIVFIGI